MHFWLARADVWLLSGPRRAEPTFNSSFIVDGDERQRFAPWTADAFEDGGIPDAR